MSLTVQGLTKSFGGELALAGVDLEIKEGEIHALLGPNGSGKSTLIGCLSGRITPDEGTILVGDRPFDGFTPRSAFAAGTAVIYQHFSLIPSLSVRDNVFLGSEYTKGFGVDRATESKRSRAILDQLGTDLDTNRKVAGLSVGQRQLVEIAKAMRHQPQVLILDEPTAALSESEASALGAQLRELRSSGLAILYVTHLLGEVFEIADRVTVLRDGKTVLESPIEKLRRSDVIAAIAPRGGVSALKRDEAEVEARPTRLKLDSFEAAGVGPIDLSVREGEVVALFGLLGSGRSEILEGIYGLRGRTGGSITLDGEGFAPRSATSSLRRGVALVPADRAGQSMFDTMSALDNLLLPSVKKLARGLIRDRRAERRVFTQSAQTLRLKPPRAAAPARTFSGGNQQKLVVGRWLTDVSNVKMLLLDEPTQGIDVGARADMYELIRGFAAKEGRSALFTSSDPEEVEALADRVLVLVRGQIVGELSRDRIKPQEMLELAHGPSGENTLVDEADAREGSDVR